MDAKVYVIKTSLKRVKWKEKYIKSLEELVQKTNRVVTNVYAFCKYVFITEKNENPNFDLRPYICASFFEEVFMSFTIRQERISEKTPVDERAFKLLISSHLRACYILRSKKKRIKVTQSGCDT